MAKKPHGEGEVLEVPWAQLGSDVPILTAQCGAPRQLGGWWKWKACAAVCVLAGATSLTPFPPVQFYLQGLQHSAPPHRALLPGAALLRRGRQHPGFQSPPGEDGQ